MKQFLSKVAAVGLIVTFAVASFSLSVQSAEKKKITGTNKPEQSVSRTVVTPGDVPNHELVQFIVMMTTTSSDPNWNDAKQMLYEQEDQVAGSGSHKGYGTHSHKDGDKSYFNYEGTHKMTVKEGGAWEQSGEGKFQWTGGTGKFKNLKGGGTYKCKFTAEGGSCDWEGEVEY